VENIVLGLTFGKQPYWISPICQY